LKLQFEDLRVKCRMQEYEGYLTMLPGDALKTVNLYSEGISALLSCWEVRVTRQGLSALPSHWSPYCSATIMRPPYETLRLDPAQRQGGCPQGASFLSESPADSRPETAITQSSEEWLRLAGRNLGMESQDRPRWAKNSRLPLKKVASPA
jgi:hypothetical protein